MEQQAYVAVDNMSANSVKNVNVVKSVGTIRISISLVGVFFSFKLKSKLLSLLGHVHDFEHLPPAASGDLQ